MVSLRDRKARPSYANVSQDLANLTDEEDELDSNREEHEDNGAGGSGSGDVPGQVADGEDDPMGSSSEAAASEPGAGAADDDSLSSGDSSEFAPSEAGGAKGKGAGGRGGVRGRGRGRGRGMASARRSTTRHRSASSATGSGSGSDGVAPGEIAEELRELGDVGEDDDDDEGDRDSDLDMLGTPPPHARGQSQGQWTTNAKARGSTTDAKARGPSKAVRGTLHGGLREERSTPASPGTQASSNVRYLGGAGPDRKRSRPLAAAPAYVQSDLNLLPAAYRSMIRTAAEAMVKPPPAKLWQHDKQRAYYETGFPGGLPVPFISRLTKSPRECTGTAGTDSWVRVEKAPERDTRRDKAVEMGDGMTVGIGWEAWEGEAWWPDMYTGSGNRDSGSDEAGPSSSRMSSCFPASVKDWRLREEVRLGLDDIGRLDCDELELLSENEVSAYLPTRPEAESDHSPSVRVHIGPHNHQQAIGLGVFDSVDLVTHISDQQGCMFSAGGPIWSLDWCPLPAHHGHTQYLAVSTLPDLAYPVPMGRKVPRETPGSVQIWSTTPATADSGGMTMRCEMVLCTQGGPMWACKWMPIGAWDSLEDPSDPRRLPKLGILAAIQLDGTVSFYSVPHPAFVKRSRGERMNEDTQPIFLKCQEPLLRIDMPDAGATCMDWYTGSKLAVGYSNGSIAVWDVLEALKTAGGGILPDAYFNVAQSCVSSITVARVPPGDGRGEPLYAADPAFILVGCYDGIFGMLDMRDPGRLFILNRARMPCYKIGWSNQNQVPLLPDSEYCVSLYKIRGIPSHRSNNVTSHRGTVWDIASSDYHTMIVTTGADGAVLLASTQLGFFRARKAPLYFHRLLELDYDQTSGEYRLTTDFVPENLMLEAAGGRKSHRKKLLGEDDPTAIKTANWTHQVGIHRAAWNDGAGLARAGMLAVGTASGLGFVQVVEPRWNKGFSVAVDGPSSS